MIARKETESGKGDLESKRMISARGAKAFLDQIELEVGA